MKNNILQKKFNYISKFVILDCFFWISALVFSIFHLPSTNMIAGACFCLAFLTAF
jgi:putative effector of murein hydrolase LrgA (UPF0299 family)